MYQGRQYQNQIDEVELGRNRSGYLQNHSERNIGFQQQYPGQVSRSSFQNKSDINSDFQINQQYVMQNDLEQLNMQESRDTKGFIRKVYGILTFQILVTTSFVAFANSSDIITVWQMRNFYLFYVALVVTIVAELALVCSNRIARKVPLNYLILLVFTIAESYMLSMMCAVYDPKLVFMVFFIASISFIGMSLYAYTAKYDLTIYGSLFWGISACMLTISLLFFFVKGTKFLFLIYSALGVIMTLMFVAVDTQMIL